MAKSLADLKAQIAALQARAELARKKEAAGVVRRMKMAIAEYGFTAEDLRLAPGKSFSQKRRQVGARKSPSAAGSVVTVAAYSDGKGTTWVGRGPRPRWLREALDSGVALDQLRVSKVQRTSSTKSALPAK